MSKGGFGKVGRHEFATALKWQNRDKQKAAATRKNCAGINENRMRMKRGKNEKNS